ncbi:hypothetical protein INR49_018188 [Caranx melampygus]|nr:hypothetical protein INR49_018188 [Caranx melampygus]
MTMTATHQSSVQLLLALQSLHHAGVRARCCVCALSTPVQLTFAPTMNVVKETERPELQRGTCAFILFLILLCCFLKRRKPPSCSAAPPPPPRKSTFSNLYMRTGSEMAASCLDLFFISTLRRLSSLTHSIRHNNT